ncbi:MAG TPA: cytochrome c peroxidase [Burkholderiales bacterium]|nr:cytochrome c peroxidase [Burkholderiales bacterium]
MRRAPLLLLLAALAPAAYAFTEAEVRAIAAHGPWPPAFARDSSNRVSGNADAIELGERLFFERRLSADGEQSCARCHIPERNWTDGLVRAQGLALVDRNTQSIANVRLQRWFGWDGANDSLWAQSIRPLLDARELGMSAPKVAALVRGDADLACRYRKVFGELPREDEAVLVGVAKALAAFQETRVSGRTPFDQFRDSLVKGDAAGIAAYPESAKRGLAIFIGKGKCNFCHLGPAFTNGEFHDTGIPFFIEKGRVDAGRHAGIQKLRASPYNLLGAHNDDSKRSSGTGTQHVRLEHRNFGEFRTPSLRNLALTAPYMHNGSLATLRDVVNHYSTLSPDRLHADGEAILAALKLSEAEARDLVAFLETLSDGGGRYERRAFRHDCRP